MGVLLFVYGTLRPGSEHPMALWLAARSDVVGVATIGGELVELDGFPGLVPGGGTVHGTLVRLHRTGDLAELDRYEDVPALFVRNRLAVAGPGGMVEAWVYVYVGGETGERVEGGSWGREAGRFEERPNEGNAR